MISITSYDVKVTNLSGVACGACGLMSQHHTYPVRVAVYVTVSQIPSGERGADVTARHVPGGAAAVALAGAWTAGRAALGDDIEVAREPVGRRQAAVRVEHHRRLVVVLRQVQLQAVAVLGGVRAVGAPVSKTRDVI